MEEMLKTLQLGRAAEPSNARPVSTRELRPETVNSVQMVRGEFGDELARRLPHLLRERKVELGQTDKVFACQWLSEEEVIAGTKCNRLFVVNVTTGGKLELPILRNRQTPEVANTCGIHCITITEDRHYLATGGGNPSDVAFYRLPDLEPVYLGRSHTDWIFDMQWITDSLLITGSRDSTMALWSTTPFERLPEGETMAEDVPSMESIFRFSNLISDRAEDLQLAGERVRSLAYNKHNYVLGSLQTNPLGATAYFWDTYMFQQIAKMDLPHCAENVCLELDKSVSSNLYAIGSRSHVTFIDGRITSRAMGSIQSLDKDSGVRSLQFNRDVLSIGTGGGHLYFYDIKAGKYLDHDTHFQQQQLSSVGACSLKASPGWLRRDQTYRDFFSGLPEPPNAIYTHCYSPLKTKIFTAGGPLPLGLCGNYAAVWV